VTATYSRRQLAADGRLWLERVLASNWSDELLTDMLARITVVRPEFVRSAVRVATQRGGAA